jgi:hypothetical protein
MTVFIELTFGARKYDSRIGRFTSVDALWLIQPEYTPYHYSANLLTTALTNY